MKPQLWRILKVGVPVLVLLAALAPFIPAAFLRSPVESALASSLHRPVSVGNVHFSFFPNGPVPGPGFTLENVTIHEDQRAGIEPTAYMPEMGASIRVLSLLTGKLELSGINLADASINLVKTPTGQWNFQYLLNSLKSDDASIPALRMRGGRVDFKFGDTKSVVYFKDADLDIAPRGDGSMEVRFSGEPSRTDHTNQDFGRFYIRGAYTAQNRFDLQVELQRSSLEEVLRLMDPQGYGVHGILALNGRVTGEPSNLQMTGNLEIGDVHRWDLLPEANQTWNLPYKAAIDLVTESIDWESTAPEPTFGASFHVKDYLRQPQWNASATFQMMPLGTLFGIARHMGATLPENLAVDGAVSGSAQYDESNGLKGQLTLVNASMQLPDNDALKTAEARLELREGAVHLAPAQITVGDSQTAQLEGSVALASPHALNLRVSSAALNVNAMKSFGLPPLPILGESTRGSWKGWARYQNERWTAAAELRAGMLTLNGLAEPLEVRSAAVSLTRDTIAISKISGRIAETPFSASFESRGTQPVRFNLALDEADAEEIERILTPALAREGPGFLARTLRLRAAPPVPAWLTARKAEGTISIANATAGDWKVRDVKARLQWDGTSIHLTNISADLDSGAATGSLDVDLATPVAKYHLEGSVNGIAYHGGTLDLTGTVDAEGIGDASLASARAEGTVRGRNIAFAPDADFRTFAAAFTMQPVGTAPRWKLTNVEANALQGSGATLEDGRLQLELGPTRYIGTLFAPKQAK